MVRRLIAILVVALLLLPNPFEQRERPRYSGSQQVLVRAVPIPNPRVGEVTVDEAWHIASANSSFGGFSSLALESPRQFLIASDFGSMLRLRLLPSGTVVAARIWPLWLDSRASLGKYGRDLEALTVDPASGTLWGAFEQSHRIVRFRPGMVATQGEARPAAMQRWNENGGAEAMTRLADGRFVVLSESTGGPGGGTDALLFPTDPVAEPRRRPLRFALDPGGRGRITDAALLPDGRVLLLFRDIGLGGWVSTLAVADPRLIRADAMWRSRTIARFTAPDIAENFEGLAVDGTSGPAAGGTGRAPGAPVTIWMLSDDNRAGWQRTLLLRLGWSPS